MSCSSSARRQNETAIATAMSASDAATSPSVIETVLTSSTLPSSSRIVRSVRRSACARRASRARATRRADSAARARPPRVAASSSADVGSSSSSTSGSSASARASITRCCSPTDSREASRSQERAVEAGQLERPLGVDLAALEPTARSARCRATVPGSGAGSWGTSPTRRRSSSGSSSRTSLPWKRTVPSSGSASRLSSRSSVDLPEPDGPSSAVEPGGIGHRHVAQHPPAVTREPDALELEDGSRTSDRGLCELRVERVACSASARVRSRELGCAGRPRTRR